MTKFYFSHVQTIPKITSSAVQTRFSMLDQSLSWIFMKSAVIKITAYRGWTPLQKSDRRCIHNHFWPTSKEKWFKTNILPTVASAVILTLGQKSAVSAQCVVEFQKKKIWSAGAREHAWSMIIKQFFSPMHTVGSTVTESKKQLTQVRSGQKLQCPGATVGW